MISWRFVFLITFILPLTLRAQIAEAEENDPLTHTLSIYQQAVGDQSALYNGTFYYAYPQPIHQGHPFFQSQSPIQGSVFYDGAWFHQVPLLYDLATDQLITYNFNKKHLLQLVKQKVDTFRIQQYTFIRISNTSPRNISDGYYQLLFTGNSLVLKKQIKSIKEKIVNQFEKNRSVSSQTRFFVRVNDSFSQVTRSRSLLNLFGPYKKEISNSLKRQKVKFNQNKEKFIVEAVSLYDQITD